MRSNLRHGTTLITALAISLTSSGVSSAALINGDFETGDLTGWTTVGDVDVLDGTFQAAPSEGNFQLVLTTSPGSVGQINGGVDSVANVNTVIGTTVAQLNSVEQASFSAFEGSGVMQTFVTNMTGVDLSFEYNFLSDETDAGNQFGDVYPDYAIVHIRNASGTFNYIRLLTDADVEWEGTAYPAANPTQFDSETGYRTFTLSGAGVPLLTPDTYTLAFATFDVRDDLFDSALLIDRLMMIPEPSTGTLTALGLAVLGARRRLRAAA